MAQDDHRLPGIATTYYLETMCTEALLVGMACTLSSYLCTEPYQNAFCL